MKKIIMQSITFAAVFAMLGLAATASANHDTLAGNKDGGSFDMSLEKGEAGHIEKGDAGHVSTEKGDAGHFDLDVAKGDAGHIELVEKGDAGH